MAEGGATVVMVLRYRAARDSVADSGSVTATVRVVAVIPQKELRNNVGEVLRRAEAGEQIAVPFRPGPEHVSRQDHEQDVSTPNTNVATTL